MYKSEINTKDLLLIFNHLSFEVGEVLVSFFFSKIFIYQSIEFVYDNILKECKHPNKVPKMFNSLNLFRLPDNYKELFYHLLSKRITIKQTDLPIISFKELNVMEKEKKEIFRNDCLQISKRKIQIAEKMEVNKANISNNIEEQFNIISKSLKQLADIGIESEITFKFYKTKN